MAVALVIEFEDLKFDEAIEVVERSQSNRACCEGD